MAAAAPTLGMPGRSGVSQPQLLAARNRARVRLQGRDLRRDARELPIHDGDRGRGAIRSGGPGSVAPPRLSVSAARVRTIGALLRGLRVSVALNTPGARSRSQLTEGRRTCSRAVFVTVRRARTACDRRSPAVAGGRAPAAPAARSAARDADRRASSGSAARSQTVRLTVAKR